MRRYYLSAAIGSCLGLLVLAGCAAPPSGTASQAPVPALQPGMARVWVLRQPSSPGGNIAASDPMVTMSVGCNDLRRFLAKRLRGDHRGSQVRRRLADLLLAGSLQGISSIRGSAARQQQQKRALDQGL